MRVQLRWGKQVPITHVTADFRLRIKGGRMSPRMARRLVAAAITLESCKSPMPQPHIYPEPAAGWMVAEQDSVVSLRSTPPADSVVLRHDGATILMSMQDVQARWAESGSALPPDLAEFRDAIQVQYDQAGWVALEDGFLPRLLAGRLIAKGQAAIRIETAGRLLPSVRMVLERKIDGTTVLDDRLFYAPDGTLVLRIPYAISVS
jgi:hypothetical protein